MNINSGTVTEEEVTTHTPGEYLHAMILEYNETGDLGHKPITEILMREIKEHSNDVFSWWEGDDVIGSQNDTTTTTQQNKRFSLLGKLSALKNMEKVMNELLSMMLRSDSVVKSPLVAEGIPKDTHSTLPDRYRKNRSKRAIVRCETLCLSLQSILCELVRIRGLFYLKWTELHTKLDMLELFGENDTLNRLSKPGSSRRSNATKGEKEKILLTIGLFSRVIGSIDIHISHLKLVNVSFMCFSKFVASREKYTENLIIRVNSLLKDSNITPLSLSNKEESFIKENCGNKVNPAQFLEGLKRHSSVEVLNSFEEESSDNHTFYRSCLDVLKPIDNLERTFEIQDNTPSSHFCGGPSEKISTQMKRLVVISMILLEYPDFIKKLFTKHTKGDNPMLCGMLHYVEELKKLERVIENDKKKSLLSSYSCDYYDEARFIWCECEKNRTGHLNFNGGGGGGPSLLPDFMNYEYNLFSVSKFGVSMIDLIDTEQLFSLLSLYFVRVKPPIHKLECLSFLLKMRKECRPSSNTLSLGDYLENVIKQDLDLSGRIGPSFRYTHTVVTPRKQHTPPENNNTEMIVDINHHHHHNHLKRNRTLFTGETLNDFADKEARKRKKKTLLEGSGVFTINDHHHQQQQHVKDPSLSPKRTHKSRVSTKHGMNPDELYVRSLISHMKGIFQSPFSMPTDRFSQKSIELAPKLLSIHSSGALLSFLSENYNPKRNTSTSIHAPKKPPHQSEFSDFVKINFIQ